MMMKSHWWRVIVGVVYNRRWWWLIFIRRRRHHRRIRRERDDRSADRHSLSYTYSFSFSQTLLLLLCLLFFLSPLFWCLSLRALDLVISRFLYKPWKRKKVSPEQKNKQRGASEEQKFWSKITLSFFFQSKKTIFNQKVLVHLYVVIHSNTHNTHEQKEHVIYHHHQISNAVLPERASLAALLLPPSADNIHQRQKCIIKSTQNREF